MRHNLNNCTIESAVDADYVLCWWAEVDDLPFRAVEFHISLLHDFGFIAHKTR